MKEEGRIMMPLLQCSYDEAIEKGMQKGIEKGRKELIAKLLKSGVDLQVLCKGTGLSEEEIKKLKKGD